MWWLLALIPFVQPAPTTFAQACYMQTADTYTVYFGYTAEAEEHYVGSGYDFVTAIGEHPQALSVTVDLMPAPNVPQLAFTRVDSDDTVYVTFDLNALPECGAEPTPPALLPTSEPTATPTEPPCEASAIDAATGLPYCYTPIEGGVVPLPPAP